MVHRKFVKILIIAGLLPFFGLMISVSIALLDFDVYFIDPPVGVVVDAETDLPLEGVSVVAIWGMQGGFGTGMSQHTIQPLYFGEAVTDPNGIFHIDVPLFIHYSTDAFDPKLGLAEPQMMIFKEGYFPELRSNRRSSRSSEKFFGKLTRVPFDLVYDGPDVVKLRSMRYLEHDISLDEESFLRVVLRVLEPMVRSCDVVRMDTFYQRLTKRIKQNDHLRNEPYSKISTTVNCNGTTYENF